MPELPEVEAARRAIESHCLGKKIKKVIVADDSKVVEGLSPAQFESSLLGKTIVVAHRKGKNLWLELDSPPFPSFQFGMTGAVYIEGVAVTQYKRSAVKDTDEWPSKFSKFFVELDDGVEMSFTDKRRLAKFRLLEDPTSVPPISELGPDALLEPKTVDELSEALSRKKMGIKALLLDQSFISGIGNWIADEVLYQARIHPLQTASSLSKENCAALHKSIKEVIEKAVEVGADSSQFPSNWIFHSRDKKPDKAFVDGKKIDFISAGGRTTAYVPDLQKLSGAQETKVKGKPRKQASRKKGENEDKGENVDETANEEESTGLTKTSSRKGGANSRGRGKKSPKRSKQEENDEDEEVDGDDDASGEEDGEADENNKRKHNKVNNNKAKAAKPSKKAPSRNSKPKKKYK